MSYALMNKDVALLEFEIEPSIGGEVAVEKRRFSEALPPAFGDINNWLSDRDYAKHKDHFQKWLRDWGMDTAEGFVNATHCLGVNDTLWVKPTGSSLAWGEVSLYSNQFDDVAKHTAFETGLHGLKLSTTSPEFTADGSFRKCWARENGKIYLYKRGDSGASNVGLEPYAEYISSSIARSLSSRACEYDLVLFKGKLCSKCELFTNEEVGYVPFSKYADLNRAQTLPMVLKKCSELGFEQEAIDMFVIDALTFNNDRHLGNFGFLVDNSTFEVVDFAPYFDFNRSMLTHATLEDFSNINEYVHSIRQSVGDLEFRRVATELLPRASFKLPREIALPFHPSLNMPEERMQLLQGVMDQHVNNIRAGSDFYMSARTLGLPGARFSSACAPSKLETAHGEADKAVPSP